MSKTLLKNNRSILALARDAYGNGISGNTERSLRFIREAVRMLELQAKIIESKGDARAQLAFEAENRRINREETTEWPQFDRSLMAGSIEQWAAKGLTPEILPAVEDEALTAMAKSGKESVQLSGDDAKRFIEKLGSV